MATIITDGTTEITPQLVLGWSSSKSSRNISHNIIGKDGPDITLKPAGLQTGTLELLFLTSSEAFDAQWMLSQALPFLIESDESFINGMYFVVIGSISSALEDTTRSMWILSVDFQQVTF